MSNSVSWYLKFAVQADVITAAGKACRTVQRTQLRRKGRDLRKLLWDIGETVCKGQAHRRSASETISRECADSQQNKGRDRSTVSQFIRGSRRLGIRPL